jgi:hypothetical protein
MFYHLTFKCALSILLFLVLACKKEEKALSRSKLLTQNSWVYSIVQHREKVGDPWLDFLNTTPSCRKDDRISFKIDGKYEVDNSTQKCTSAEQKIIETGKWQFSEDETKITLTMDGGTTTVWNISQLDESVLKVDFTRIFLFQATLVH